MSRIVSLLLFAFFVMQANSAMAGALQKANVLTSKVLKEKQQKEEKPHEKEETAESTLELLDSIAGNAQANAKIIRMLARGFLSKKTRFVKAFFKDYGSIQNLRTAEQDFVISILDLLEGHLSEILRNSGEEFGFWVPDEGKGFNQVFHDCTFVIRKPDADWDESWQGSVARSEGFSPDVNKSWIDITCKTDADQQPAVVSKLGWSFLNDLKSQNSSLSKDVDNPSFGFRIGDNANKAWSTSSVITICHKTSEPLSEGVRRIFEDMIRKCPFADRIRSAGEDQFDRHKDHVNAVLKNKGVTADQFKEFLFPQDCGHLAIKSPSHSPREHELNYPSNAKVH
ncbi:hypothetical protein [Candidatus Finniella inopinata]|uniref:Uncharacterized protein n=1 Tax=Candidatus Finniella inopinata TaxID=1696036 RepID=A0A4Q7DNK2_9PROT|nr:hypothetical protein [Candidatus Finniella inopinata]RZI46466.1 hypothetical protein EQU50_02460 [Candidatus Finniella inopinata]